MAAIDIGDPAINRPGNYTNGFTFILLGNPANESGTLDEVKIWCTANISGCKVGTFYLDGSDPNYINRDSATLGNVTQGSEQTFSGLSIDVISGDFIGIYYSGGNMEATTSGETGLKFVAGDQMGTGSQNYGTLSGDTMSLNATGETAGTNMQVNIGDSYKAVAAAKVNVGDSWKDVAGIQVNIGDSWKTVM